MCLFESENYSILMIESKWEKGPIPTQPLWSITNPGHSCQAVPTKELQKLSWDDRYNCSRINNSGMRRASL